jgi:uncharacterized protein YyaL (SSP411 family)
MANRLAAEPSPYLRQHADNPVDWWPWGDEALALARRENRPILLSIGYSACHWCHVMAHESFEDDATARLMNELYVNIKVDREERPDLDKLYQIAHQALQRRGGGWPLTVFLTPDDHLPFFAGTYFPKRQGHGMPTFAQVLREVRRWYDERQGEVRQQNAALRQFLTEHLDPASGEAVPGPQALEVAATQLARSFDPRHGGFGAAPKFPHCADLELLLAVSAGDGAVGAASAATGAASRNRPVAAEAAPTALSLQCLRMVERTLEAMASGGIHDQIGGGFSRYSVDARWEIPHFEKMLYDNAQLLPLYARGAVLFEAPFLRAAADGIVAWLDREMAAPGGGYHAALDADSEGEEGRFYVWQRDEARHALSDAEWAVAEPVWGFDRPPNFEDHAWNPVFARTPDSVASGLGIDADAARQHLESARAKLFALRAKRVRPGTDDKVLTAWNALLAAGLARASRYAREPAWAARAVAIADHVDAHAWRDGKLHASIGAGGTRLPAYLDDHAFLLDALVELLATTFRADLLGRAVRLADALLARFEDGDAGGFWFTAHDHEALIGRAKPMYDESIPTGNGVAARALLRLGHLLGELRYLEAAVRALRAAAPTIAHASHGCASLVAALRELHEPPAEVVIRLPDDGGPAWCDVADALRVGGTTVYLIPPDAGPLPGLLGERRAMDGGVAYVCRGTSCLAPIRSAADLAAAL